MACELLIYGGADRDRTDDLLNAIQALSQLSYGPTKRLRRKRRAFLLLTTIVLRNIDKRFAKVKSAIHNLLKHPEMTFPSSFYDLVFTVASINSSA